jgi:hypothetical protein
VANQFIKQPKNYREYTDAEISAAVTQFKRTGYCKLGSKTYKLCKDDPRYYLIYRGHSFLTDGYTDDLESDLKDDAAFNAELNADHKPNGKLVTAQIPIDAIVWVDNDLNCKEFITKVNPLSM